MDILRRNTDYALRMMITLAEHWHKKPISTRTLSKEGDVPYQLACKLLQKLHKAGLVKSCRGPKGGFKLSRKPSKINLLKIIETIQGPMTLNRCLINIAACTRQATCPVSRRLVKLQKYLGSFLNGITLDQLLSGGSKRKSRNKRP